MTCGRNSNLRFPITSSGAGLLGANIFSPLFEISMMSFDRQCCPAAGVISLVARDNSSLPGNLA